ncbi:uncharacterized protein LOC128557111 [Mercenaria mercenaria]|uniref:uncharacterized protein LOC128557111 n=1 Tax=Mercenaria mercenaria TaxID=6596 RepID=UPI00234F54BA|nr:uncharacterized protein LOC128557111 [Mercenaria mercenaria]
MVKALKAMYSTVKSCVRYNHSQSDFFESHVGLKQGDPSSPLLFMFFVNDLMNNINSDLNDIFTIEEMKLFLLLYADDQAVFARSPDSLQKLLNDIENYCNAWGLRINTAKTKIMIFEKGRLTHHDFYLYGSSLEVVNSFKYLGVSLYRNGNWYRSQKDIAKHASYALNGLFQIFKSIELPNSQKCKLFDALVSSILHFGGELIGSYPCTDLELVHTKFLRRILLVKRSTNTAALYGELGRVPLVIIRKVRMIKYWLKILKSPHDSLIYKTYEMLRLDANASRSYNGRNWAFQIKQLLQEHGFSNVWDSNVHEGINFLMIRQRIFDMYHQQWYASINNSSKLKTYSVFKHDFNFESYLDNIAIPKFRIALSKFRVSIFT